MSQPHAPDGATTDTGPETGCQVRSGCAQFPAPLSGRHLRGLDSTMGAPGRMRPCRGAAECHSPASLWGAQWGEPPGAKALRARVAKPSAPQESASVRPRLISVAEREAMP